MGAGTRTIVGLTLLTACVNAFWLVVAPYLGWLRWKWYPALGSLRGSIMLLAGIVAASLVEPVWYRLILTAFSGQPLPWAAAVVARADVNLLIAVLAIAVSAVAQVYTLALSGQRERDELESHLVDAQARALTLQLQPHFLFNTLQLAAEAAYDDIGAARRIVGDLEHLLRRTFAFEELSLVRVADEVAFLGSYVAIQRSRFGSRLAVDIQVEPPAREAMIPPLLLQPLVENSIQHGLSPLARDGRIVVRLTTDAKRLLIEVRDDGVGFRTGRQASGSGLGLAVTRRRLRALYQEDHQMTLTAPAEGGARVSISLPLSVERAEPTVRDARLDIREAAWGRARWIVLAVTLVLLANVAVAEILLRQGAVTQPAPGRLPGSIAVWIPAQLLALAGVVVVLRAHRLKQWLHGRDHDTHVLRTSIEAVRTRVAALRAGKDPMLAALARIAAARSPSEFDALVVEKSQLIRTLVNND